MVAVLEMSVWHVARWARCVAQVYLCVCVCLPPALCVCPFCVCVCVYAPAHSYASIGKLICLVGVSVCLGSSGCASTSHPCHEDAVLCKWECVHSSWHPWQVGRWGASCSGAGPCQG